MYKLSSLDTVSLENRTEARMKTITIAVAEVLEGGTKSEFYSELRKSLDLSVRLSNLCVTECARQDDLSKEKAPKLYTYQALKKLGLLKGVANAASSISRLVEKHYTQDRWMMIRGKRSLRSYRSQPWPLLHNKSISQLKIEDTGECLTARIKVGEGWWTVKLAGGEGYRRQVGCIRNAINQGRYGDSKIWINHKGVAIIGVSCDMPNIERKELSGSMSVSSSRESLLVATLEQSDVPFVINADIVHQWKSEANKRYQRLRQDRKSDANRRRIRREMNALSQKTNNRMKTLCHEVAARIVNKAIRSGVAEIKLDLTIKSYSRLFPWYDLAGKIKYKAESAGIKVVDATQTTSDPDTEKPHVYFKLAPIAGRVKIGMTGREDGGRHKGNTDSPEDLVILAVDNQPKTKLRSREKHFHALFQEHRLVGEWFQSEPILAWLREVEWLGNAGNLSQIAQVLEVSQDTSSGGHLWANSERRSDVIAGRCSHKADKKRGYVDENQPAPRSE